MRSLVWFRRDLRVNDNTAFFQACKSSSDGVIGLFLIAGKQWHAHNDAPCKVKFWLESLEVLSAQLEKLNIPLRIETSDVFDDAAATVIKMAKKFKCSSVYFNREYEVNEVRRDRGVARLCREKGVDVHRFHDRIVVPPREIKTKQNKFYSVFTPYRKVWDIRSLEYAKPFKKPGKQVGSEVKSSAVPKKVEGFDFSECRTDLWKAGEVEGTRLLKAFSSKIQNYSDARDVPSVAGTSLLSPHLAAVTVSPRQCLTAALELKKEQVNLDGATIWISELAWRDFYTQVMVACPRVSMHQPFKLKTNGIKWRDNEDDLNAWKNGQTGYPIVDAGMRQLNQTGWMHNRLRMVTAMFLSKNLLIDWRLGEKYFMETLIDGDLAANNGGWQWSASTGTDSVPYFRIFNPFSQSKRFDSDGVFIKKMCPELSAVSASALHDPKKLTAAIEAKNLSYPKFVVDYKTGRERVLSEFKSLG